MRILVLSFLLLSTPVLAASPLDRSIVAAAQAYDTALALAEEQRYGPALPLLRSAAAGGDVRAQRMLALMLFHGESLFGSEVRRDRAEAATWFRLAAAQGCAVSRFYLERSYGEAMAKPGPVAVPAAVRRQEDFR